MMIWALCIKFFQFNSFSHFVVNRLLDFHFLRDVEIDDATAQRRRSTGPEIRDLEKCLLTVNALRD